MKIVVVVKLHFHFLNNLKRKISILYESSTFVIGRPDYYLLLSHTNFRGRTGYDCKVQISVLFFQL
jgi:hypothetical protein